VDTPRDPQTLLATYLDAVADVEIVTEHKVEIVINLAKSAGLADAPLKAALRQRLGDEALEHPYFYWQPRPRWVVGASVRVIDGAPMALGKTGRVEGIEDPRRHGVRGMTRSHVFTVILDDDGERWGFSEEQLEDAPGR
jgi:hypothetical protein